MTATRPHITDQLAVIIDLLRQQQQAPVSEQERREWAEKEQRYETMLTNLVAALKATKTISDEDIERELMRGVE